MPDDSGLRTGGWDGTTYYRREQLKAAPFNNWLVGGYIFLAGLSGGAAMLSALLDFTLGRRAARAVRRGRWLALLAPTVGAACLISDLHTPRRFYNMLRMFKATSPMSIGSWILVAFGVFSSLTAAGGLLARARGVRRVARAAQVPAALAGAGLGTYTAALLSATSTPLWAAAPCATAVRFGASSVAAGAAALSLGQGRSRVGRDLDMVAVAALATELAATAAADRAYRRQGVAAAMRTTPGNVETLGAGVIGTWLPLGLYAVSIGLGRRSPGLSNVASLAILGGSAVLRVAFLAAGDVSAQRPEISLRFAQPENLEAGK